MGKKLDEEIFTPKETPSLEEVLNSEQETIENEGINNEIKDDIHTFVKTSNIEVPQGNEVESGTPLTVTIDDQIITPKKNRIDFQGYELDNISEADGENDVPPIKQVRKIIDDMDKEKQDKLTAGENITITSDNVISATDTTYTAGTGLTLTDTEFSIGSKAVENGMLADDGVTNNKLADNAVTSDKIADNAVTASKVASGSITPDQLDWSKVVRTDISSTATSRVSSITRALTYKFGKIMRVNIACVISSNGNIFNIGAEVNETVELSCVTNGRATTRCTISTTGDVSVATLGSYNDDIYIQGTFFIK